MMRIGLKDREVSRLLLRLVLFLGLQVEELLQVAEGAHRLVALDHLFCDGGSWFGRALGGFSFADYNWIYIFLKFDFQIYS